MREFHAFAQVGRLSEMRFFWVFFSIANMALTLLKENYINRVDSMDRDARVLGLSAETKTNQQRL